MSVLEKVKKMDEQQVKDDDHPEKPDLTAAEFDRALDELAEKYKNSEPENKIREEEKKKRGDDILKSLNSTDNPY